jgi:CRP-like cAMP-binding protein
MRGAAPATIRRVDAGRSLVEQGDADDGELYLLLNGVLVVVVDGEAVAEIGPGAVFGERAALGDGRRSATLRAVTDCKFAAAPLVNVDLDRLDTLAAGHHHEDV